MTRVFKNVEEWREFRGSRSLRGKSLGFVPTMGALHRGHVSLFEAARRENDRVVASLFVNPTQFNDPTDLERYPRTFDQDLEKLEAAGVDYLIAPSPEQMYQDGYRYQVSENRLSRELCGAHRPGHFDGVLTVVLKLLNLARADRAYFGEKDYQQYLLIRGMAEAFFLPTQIISCPTIREEDGLAMSSRNALLTPEQRELAAEFAQRFARSTDLDGLRAELRSLGLQVDYLEQRQNRRYAAVRLGGVRLIDNYAVQGSDS